MMDFNAEFSALSQILLEQKKYRDAIFKVNMEEKLSINSKKRLLDNVLGILRHYFTLSFEALSLLPYKKESDENILAIILLYHLRYIKKASDEEIKSCYLKSFADLRLIGDQNNDFEILKKASLNKFVIPEKLKESPIIYNSLLLEMPSFLLKTISNEFSPQIALQSSIYLHKRPTFFYASKGKEPKVEGSELITVPINDNEVIYKTDTPISLSSIHQKDLYPIGYLEALAYSELPIPYVEPHVMLIGLSDGFDMVPIGLRINECYQNELACIFPGCVSFRSGNDAKYHYKLKNVSIQNCSFSLAKTYFETEKYDDVICYGSDLKIGLARKNPARLPTLKESLIEESIERQINELNESSLFVKKGGYLLFINHSIIKEETYDLINSFLNKHNDFILIKKEIIFPNQLDNDAGFYALLKKKGGKHE